MASNKELIEKIHAIDESVEVKDLNNEQLSNKLGELKKAAETKKLVDEIKGLDSDAEVDGLTDEQLVAKLAELKKDAASDDKKGAADAAKVKADADAAKAAKPAPKKPDFEVATGKAITTKRGIRSDGDEIKVDDLAGGKSSFDALVKSGHIIKN